MSSPDALLLTLDHWNQRYTLCIMGIIGCTSMSANRICLNHAIEVITSTHDGRPAEFSWTSIEQGWAKASYFVGFIPSSIPGGILADYFGGKIVFVIGCSCSAVATILTPVATRLAGLGGMIGLRILMGAGEAMTFPAGSNLLSKWVPPEERGRLAGFILTAPQLGLIVGNIGSGYMLRDFDWAVSFYVWGSICLFYCIAFYFVCYTDPRYHPFISRAELKFLYENVTGVTEVRKSPPWRHIISSVRVWSAIFCVFGFFWCYFSIVMDLPKFMHHVMQFDIAERGVMIAVPFAVMYIFSLISCYMADFLLKKHLLKRLTIRKVYAFTATVIPSFSIVGAYYCGSHIPAVTICLFALSLAFMAFYYCGVQINSLDLSPRNSGLVTALINTFGASAALLAPIANGSITATNEESDWHLVGWISFAFMIGGVFPFLLFASADRQWWDSQVKVDEYNRKRKLERRLRELDNNRNEEIKTVETAKKDGKEDEKKEETKEEEEPEDVAKINRLLKKDEEESKKEEEDREETRLKGILKKETDEGSRRGTDDSSKGILKKEIDEPSKEEVEEEKRVTIQEPEENEQEQNERRRVTIHEPDEEEETEQQEEETEEQKQERRRRDNQEAGR